MEKDAVRTNEITQSESRRNRFQWSTLTRYTFSSHVNLHRWLPVCSFRRVLDGVRPEDTREIRKWRVKWSDTRMGRLFYQAISFKIEGD